MTFFTGLPRATIQLCSAFNPECLSGSPHQFSALLKELRNTSRRLPSLKLAWYAGAQASSALVHEMRRTLCPNVACVYGSTEVGAISSCFVHDASYQPEMAGYLLPDVVAQIVDDADNVLRVGCEGIIRVKSLSMARGYHGHKAETLRVYHDGWFYPGDRGKLSEDGVLELTGRHSEIINRGGAKIDPFQIDVVAQSYPGVIDAASFRYEDEQGLEDICLAVVASEHFNWDGLSQHLRGALAPGGRPSSYVRVSTIPRNAVGKVMRNQLSQAKRSAGVEGKRF
jgi:acyl-coenzyme A synthetase/AMP-(fatty) acid ligase